MINSEFNKKLRGAIKQDSRNFTITEPMKKHYVIEIDGKKWTISNSQREVFLGYLKWAQSHTPTFETGNLIGNLLGWPEWYPKAVRDVK